MTPPEPRKAGSMGDNGEGVRFTVKELLLELRSDVKEIRVGLEQKVDRAEFVELQGRVQDFEKHGSSQAIEALRELNEIRKEMGSVREEQLRRAHLVSEHVEDHKRLAVLETLAAKESGGRDWFWRAVAAAPGALALAAFIHG